MKNKIIVITGGSSGIGLELTKLLKTDNKVFVLSRNFNEDMKKGLNWIKTDVRVVPQIESVRNKVKNLIADKKIDLLINCAGVGRDIPLEKLTEKNFDNIISTNLKGLVFTTQLFLPLLMQGSGVICNISSIAGVKGFADWSIYCASKFGVEGFTKSLREEIRPKSIRVISVRPGAVNTPLYNFLNDNKKRDFIDPRTVARLIIGACNTPKDTCVEEIIINNSVGDL